MKVKSLLAAVLLVATAPSMAATIEVFNLGAVSVPGGVFLTNAFSTAGDYQDQYNFSIASDATGLGWLDTADWSGLDINVTKVSLWSNGSEIASDTTPGSFNFGALSAGAYQLNIFSTVTGDSDWCWLVPGVGYGGALLLSPTRTTSVPEPGTLALFGVALVGIALVMRRRGIHG